MIVEMRPATGNPAALFGNGAAAFLWAGFAVQAGDFTVLRADVFRKKSGFLFSHPHFCHSLVNYNSFNAINYFKGIFSSIDILKIINKAIDVA